MIQIINRNTLLLSFLILLNFNLNAAPLPSKIEVKNLISGEKISLTTIDSGKKATVMVFMSSKCPCSDSHAAVIKNLIEKYKEFAFVIIHSNVNEDESQAKKYFASLELKAQVLQDEDAKIADMMKAYKTPHAFIIDNKGEIIYKGGVTDSNNALKAEKQYLADALEDLQQNRPLKLSETKALGCFIAREKD